MKSMVLADSLCRTADSNEFEFGKSQVSIPLEDSIKHASEMLGNKYYICQI